MSWLRGNLNGRSCHVASYGIIPIRWLRELSGYPKLWTEHYARIFGEEPQATLNGATVRRMCRRSEIKAARWLEAEIKVEYRVRACRCKLGPMSSLDVVNE